MALGPKAPKDPEKKLKSFYIMRRKQVAGNEQPDGSYIQFLYMDGGRMISAARLVGSITDEDMLKLMETTEGFRKLVKKIGVTVEAVQAEDVNENVNFHFQMYGKEDLYGKGSTLLLECAADGMERVLDLDEHPWNGEENIPGQIRFSFAKPKMVALVSVRFYLNEGFDAPPCVDEKPVDTASPEYAGMIEKAIMHYGNPYRLKKVIEKAQKGEKVTIAAIGGSITQGAGAVPINKECYSRKFYEGFLTLTGADPENVTYIKAGVGGTPSELGMIRYEVDVLNDYAEEPDLVVVEFAVNDAGDETGGVCYESLVKRILLAPNAPAVILLFAVFADDWNLQDRLIPVAEAYNIPAVSVKNAVSWQFLDPKKMIMTRNQFFYDRFHPTNLGHTIMADCMLYLVRQVMADEKAYEDDDYRKVVPAIGDTFTEVKLVDQKHSLPEMEIAAGSFGAAGGPKQLVERNMDAIGTPEFAFNWYYEGNETKESFAPFTMKVHCRAALIVMMDSADPKVGKAVVLVDGKEVLHLDPLAVGWVHNSPYICLNETEAAWHEIQVVMEDDSFDKSFSISGFGIVQ
ncbi:MAG: SGNH/GDSL hydrolase family protein [Clostridiales bacterium]|nr:SGNH/GDSL hydrolase family protein [Candidatus Blautia equi]